MTPEEFDAIKARADAATAGPWIWSGDAKWGSINLATWNYIHKNGKRFGRVTVMDFVRMGMQGAQPRFRDGELMMRKAQHLAQFEVCHSATHIGDSRVYRYDIDGIRHPDAEFIAHSRADVSALIAEVEQLRSQLYLH